MTRAEVLGVLCEAALLPAHAIQPGDIMAAIAGWDSLAGLDFQRLVAERWGMELDGMRVSEAATVADLLGLFAGRLQD